VTPAFDTSPLCKRRGSKEANGEDGSSQEARQSTSPTMLHINTGYGPDYLAGLQSSGVNNPCWGETPTHPLGQKPGSEAGVQNASGRGMLFPKAQACPAEPSAARVTAAHMLPPNPEQQGQPRQEAGVTKVPKKGLRNKKAKKQPAKHASTTTHASVVQLANLLTTEGSQCVQPTVPSGRPQRSVAAAGGVAWASAYPESKPFGSDKPKEILPSRIPVLGLSTLTEADETNLGLLSKHRQQFSDGVPVPEGSGDPLNDLARLCASLAETQSTAGSWPSTAPTATHWACQARTPSSAASQASPERSPIGWARTPSPTASPARSPLRPRSPTVGSCQRDSSPAYVDPVGMVLFNELEGNRRELPPRSPDMRWARTPSTVFSPSVSPQRRESDFPGARVPNRGPPSVDVHRLNDIFCASTQPQPLTGCAEQGAKADQTFFSEVTQ